MAMRQNGIDIGEFVEYGSTAPDEENMRKREEENEPEKVHKAKPGFQ